MYLSFHLLVQGSIINALFYDLIASLKLHFYQLGQVIIFLEALLLLLGQLLPQIILYLIPLKIIIFEADCPIAGVFREDDLVCIGERGGLLVWFWGGGLVD